MKILGTHPDGRAMTVRSLLFRLDGRIPRSVYWVATISTVIGFYAAVLLAVRLMRGSTATVISATVVVMGVMLWCVFAIQAKRWQDRGRSPLMCFVGLIPLIGGLWVLIECGCLEGNAGPNRFGADPLAAKQTHVPWR